MIEALFIIYAYVVVIYIIFRVIRYLFRKTIATAAPAEPSSKGDITPVTRVESDRVMRSFFLRKETDQAMKKIILDLESKGMDYDKSELVEDLLTGWLAWHQFGGSIDDYMSNRTPRESVKKKNT
jgi:hypothetical protein